MIMQKKVLTFMEYQHQWNIFKQTKCEENQVDTSRVPIFKASMFAGTIGVSEKKMKEERRDAMA